MGTADWHLRSEEIDGYLYTHDGCCSHAQYMTIGITHVVGTCGCQRFKNPVLTVLRPHRVHRTTYYSVKLALTGA